MESSRLSSGHLNGLALDGVPGHKDGAEDGGGTKSGGNVKGVGDGTVVGDLDGFEGGTSQSGGDFGGTEGDDLGGVEARDVGGGDVGNELVGEDVLGDADEESATKGLGKHHDGSADGDVIGGERGLDSNHGLLHAHTDTHAEDELVSDPVGGGSVDGEGGQETSANAHHDGRNNHEWGVVSENGNETTRNNGQENDGQNHGQVLDTRLNGRRALDSLEPEREVEDEDEESSTKSGTEKGTSPDGTVFEDARGHGSLLALPDLDTNEASEEDASENKEGNDAAAVPGVHRTTPLESKKKADDTRNEEDGALQIKGEDLVLDGGLLEASLAGEVEEENKEQGGNGTKGEVDVEAPSPGQAISEGAAHERTGNTGNTVHGTNNTHVGRALVERHRALDDKKSTGEDTSGTETSDGTAENETGRVGSGAADEGAELEEAKGDEEDALDAVEGVEFTVDEGECAGGEQVGGAVPADIVDGLEFIGNTGDGGSNDGVVLRAMLANRVRCGDVGRQLTRAMQKTARHSATEIRNRRHLAGYSVATSWRGPPRASSTSLGSTFFSLAAVAV